MATLVEISGGNGSVHGLNGDHYRLTIRPRHHRLIDFDSFAQPYVQVIVLTLGERSGCRPNHASIGVATGLEREDGLLVVAARALGLVVVHDEPRDGVLARALEDLVVVGDLEGQLHWLKRADGEIAARAGLGGAGFGDGLVIVDDVLYVQNRDGSVGAFRLRQ